MWTVTVAVFAVGMNGGRNNFMVGNIFVVQQSNIADMVQFIIGNEIINALIYPLKMLIFNMIFLWFPMIF